MLKTLKELFHLLTAEQRRRFYRLQILVVLMALMELLGIASIGPFMALVADMDLLQSNSFLQRLYTISGVQDPMDFLFIMGLGELIMLALASVISILTTWRLSTLSLSVGLQLAGRLHRRYLRHSWLFRAGGCGAQLPTQFATGCQRVPQQLSGPLMQLIARLMLSLCIAGAIILCGPRVALVGLTLFGGG